MSNGQFLELFFAPFLPHNLNLLSALQSNRILVFLSRIFNDQRHQKVSFFGRNCPQMWTLSDKDRKFFLERKVIISNSRFNLCIWFTTSEKFETWPHSSKHTSLKFHLKASLALQVRNEPIFVSKLVPEAISRKSRDLSQTPRNAHSAYFDILSPFSPRYVLGRILLSQTVSKRKIQVYSAINPKERRNIWVFFGLRVQLGAHRGQGKWREACTSSDRIEEGSKFWIPFFASYLLYIANQFTFWAHKGSH